MEVLGEKQNVGFIREDWSPYVVRSLQTKAGRKQVEGIKVRALVVSSIDYKESDKLITLCSVEQGKITANLKGCRKQKSKLRFCGAPFCFCEYILSEKNGFYVVTGATAIEQFSDISSNLDKFYAGSVILETLNKIVKEGEDTALLVANALTHLKSLNYEENTDEGIVLLSFFLTLYKQAGYALSFDSCKICRATSFNKKYFSKEHGGVVCNICSGRDASVVSNSAVNLMKSISDGIKLSVLRFEKSVIYECLSLMSEYFVYLTKEKVNSLKHYFDISKTT